jgi:SAM-dependent methyltransferase
VHRSRAAGVPSARLLSLLTRAQAVCGAAAPTDAAALADNAAVATYVQFARYYDALMTDPLANAARIRGYLARHLPGARTLLELGCGSGSILAGLDGVASLTGLDRSPQMLERARAKVPAARLIEADMTTFDLGERFDVVICVFDTLNHLGRFDLWRALFERAAAHLHDGGLFAFDVNTLGQLRRLAAAAPWTIDVPGATVTQDVEWRGGPRFTWHVRIREQLGDGRVRHHHERIGELGVELATIAAELAPRFTLLESSDDDGAAPSDESVRAYLAYRRRRRAPAALDRRR